MSGLADFITARLAEDEAMAKACAGYRWRAAPADILIDSDDSHWNGACVANAEGDSGQHIARHDPARVLREVTAKRAMVALHAIHSEPERWGSGHPDLAMRGQPTGRTVYWCDECDHDRDYGHIGIAEVEGCTTMRLLAAPYSDHGDYRAEWQPAL